MDGFFKWLRKQVDILTSISILTGLAGATIVMFGGHIPPFVEVSTYVSDKQTAAELQKATVDTLNGINQQLKSMGRRIDGEDCAKLVEQLAVANAALTKNPADPLAVALKTATLAQARELQNCQP